MVEGVLHKANRRHAQGFNHFLCPTGFLHMRVSPCLQMHAVDHLGDTQYSVFIHWSMLQLLSACHLLRLPPTSQAAGGPQRLARLRGVPLSVFAAPSAAAAAAAAKPDNEVVKGAFRPTNNSRRGSPLSGFHPGIVRL